MLQEAESLVQSDQDVTVPTEVPPLPPVPTAVGAHDLEAQRDWEQYQKTRGIWRYRASLQREVQRGADKGKKVDRALADLEPGQRIADDLIVPLVEAITKAQDEARDALLGRGNPSPVHSVMLSLPAEVMAVVTIQAALSRCEPAQFQGCCLDLGNKIMREVELRVWAAREKAAEKERKETGADWKPNLYDLMVKRNDKVDERVFTKWAKKADLFVKGDWEQTTRVRVGVALFDMLIGIDGWFEVRTTRDGAKTKMMFQLTDAARAWVARRHNQNEMARPFLLPMICEPRDYEYLPTPAAQPADCDDEDDLTDE